MTKKIITLALLLITTATFAQRTTDRLDRGLVAVPATTGSGNLVSWRVFGEEYYDVTYNLYCDGTQIAKNLTASNYAHTSGTASSKYQVAAVVRGKEQAKSDVVTRWNNGVLTIPVQKITGRDGTDVTSNYTLNDISLGDLDGDGIVEFIVKRPCSKAADVSQKNCFHVLDCYDHKGNRLWWIDLGPNMLSGADEQWDCVCYDWDGDGKAEVLLRIQDNAYIHYADGTQRSIRAGTVSNTHLRATNTSSIWKARQVVHTTLVPHHTHTTSTIRSLADKTAIGAAASSVIAPRSIISVRHSSMDVTPAFSSDAAATPCINSPPTTLTPQLTS
jgi:hypothetical protein